MNSLNNKARIQKLSIKQQQNIRKRIGATTYNDSYAIPPQELGKADDLHAKTIKTILNIIDLTIRRLKYSPITHFASLLMLNSFKLQIRAQSPKLIALTLVVMAAKIYQDRVPKYSKLIKWGKGEFDKEQLVLIQAEILKQNDYSVPIISENLCQDEIRTKISNLQQTICLVHYQNVVEK